MTSHRPLSHPRCPVIPIRTVRVSIRLGSWVTEQNQLGVADVSHCDLSRGPRAGSNFVQASPQHLLFQLLHVVGEETFSFCGDLNASFKCSSYLDTALTSDGSMAVDRSCKIRRKKTADTAVSMQKKKKSVIFTVVMTLNPFNGPFGLPLLLCPGYSASGSQCLSPLNHTSLRVNCVTYRASGIKEMKPVFAVNAVSVSANRSR